MTFLISVLAAATKEKDCAYVWFHPSGTWDKWAMGRPDEAIGICVEEVGGREYYPRPERAGRLHPDEPVYHLPRREKRHQGL